jgi:alpha-glucoside transport system substrate-binding protein
MRIRRVHGVVAIVLAMALVAAACGDDDADDVVEGVAFNLFGAPTGAEADAMSGFLDVYNEVNGTNITFQGSPDFEVQLRIQVEGGNPPTVAFVPQPGSICEFAEDGHLVSLETMGFDIAAMQANHGQFWMDLGLCDDGQHYGIPWFPNFKSIVFYNTAVFETEGYTPPATYEDMVALSEQMVADGYTPWCMGFGSGDATGWPGTDWIEDIMVRMHGGDVYDQWWKHEIPFNDSRVVAAFDKFGEIMFGDGFVIGGPANVAGITFQDSPLPMFADPPGCVMLKQGSFIANFFPEGVTEDDWDVFPFPTIDGNTGALGGGDTIIVFDAQEGIPAVIQDWISPEWQCVLASASGGTASQHGGHGVAGIERLPGHKDVDPNCYETSSARAFATSITEALADNAFVFDASDLMPPAVGQGSFWEGMVNWTRGTSSQAVTDAIEASWP